DYVLQSVGGTLYQITGRAEASLKCRVAALALRPDDVDARLRLGESLYFLGHLVDAVAAFMACLAKAPDLPEAHYDLGLCLENLGDYEGAFTQLSRAVQLDDRPDWHCDLLAVRYWTRRASKDEVVSAIANESRMLPYATEVFALLDGP